jgi:hypothetical protein
MIKGVMTFLPKPERNSIWVFAHDAPDQPRRYTGGAGRNIAGSALVTRIHVMASKGRVFALAPLPLEPWLCASTVPIFAFSCVSLDAQ